jgi:glutamate/tyrosine decarboxylase-like PLP-dependent enzyme
MSDGHDLLRRTAELAVQYLGSLPERPVKGGYDDVAALRSALVTELPETGEDPAQVIELLADVGGRAAVAMAGPLYFGFVIGGSLPAALAADWLTSTWDQNAVLYAAAPAAAVAEEAVGRWLLELFGLPPASGYGLVTGCQMAHFT